MEEKIKDIISRYTKIPVEQINSSTIIDRSAVSGSILLHRMYASLATEGFAIENYWDIKNFGMLLQRINRADTSRPILIQQPENDFSNLGIEPGAAFGGIGIDMENISSMPLVNDFREDEFYKMNFTSAEIAYCILQPNALSSFAGLFAAKEAIIKANNNYQNKPFNSIFIDHLPSGKPFHNEFQISISHTDKVAIAMAVSITGNSPVSTSSAIQSTQSSKAKISPVMWLAFLALILSLISISIIIFKDY